jgi:hypothetical protein
MADRAYLYSDDRPDAWSAPQEGYYDSRWTIPLAWFFFFEPGDVRLIEVDHGGANWQEVRLSAEKECALEVFERRKALLLSAIARRLGGDAVERFLSTVRGRPGRYLLMDPDEVLGGINGGFADDRGHAERIAQILAILGDGSCSAEAAREATGPYVKDPSSDPDRCEVQILGYTYW